MRLRPAARADNALEESVGLGSRAHRQLSAGTERRCGGSATHLHVPVDQALPERRRLRSPLGLHEQKSDGGGARHLGGQARRHILAPRERQARPRRRSDSRHAGCSAPGDTRCRRAQLASTPARASSGWKAEKRAGRRAAGTAKVSRQAGRSEGARRRAPTRRAPDVPADRSRLAHEARAVFRAATRNRRGRSRGRRRVSRPRERGGMVYRCRSRRQRPLAGARTTAVVTRGGPNATSPFDVAS
jgi:hypothetical protein